MDKSGGMAAEDQAGLVRDLGWLAALSTLSLLTAIVFLAAPGIDLWVSGLFGSADGFPLDRHPVALWLNDFIENIAIVLALFGLGGLGYALFTGRTLLSFGTRQFGFLVLSLLLGPGLIANLILKNNWGRARPRQILEFGGTQDFTPPLVMADQCARNCSFVSGDASMGFATLALALLIPFATKRFVKAAILFGCLMGLVRMVQGAHFLSDVMFSGFFMSLTILTLKMIILDGRWGVLARLSGPSAEAGQTLKLASVAALEPLKPRLERTASDWRGRLGLVHDEGGQTWRREAFARLDLTTWRRRVWLFFRSSPNDFQGSGPFQPEIAPATKPAEPSATPVPAALPDDSKTAETSSEPASQSGLSPRA